MSYGLIAGGSMLLGLGLGFALGALSMKGLLTDYLERTDKQLKKCIELMRRTGKLVEMQGKLRNDEFGDGENRVVHPILKRPARPVDLDFFQSGD